MSSITTCIVCGRTKSLTPSRALREGTYCSKECMAQDYRTRLRGAANPHYQGAGHRTCAHCGCSYHSYNKTRRFCSLSCAGKQPRPGGHTRTPAQLHAAKHRTPRAPKPDDERKQYRCAACAARIVKGRKFCQTCSPRGNRTVTYQCVVCGTSIVGYVSAVRRVCSRACYALLLSEQQKGDRSHLWRGGKLCRLALLRKRVEYKTWRRTIFERDDFSCQLCEKRGGKLSAHHVIRFAVDPTLRFHVGNGITLCWPCHASIRHKESQYEVRFFAHTGGVS